MSTISFWFKTLSVIPQVSKNEWGTLDIISKWLVATRSAVFIMTAFSAAIGGLLAYHYTGTFNTINFIICLIGLVFAHAANNLLNDLIDFKKGIDDNNYYRTLYGPQIIEKGYLSLKSFYGFIAASLLVALASGVLLILRTDITTLYLMLGGLVLLLFYTWPLKYIGLGEPTVVLVWGPLMIGGAFYVISNGIWSWDAVYISLIYALGPTSVLFGKHIDKSDKDKVKKVFTIPVILGEKLARYTTLVIWALQYILFFYLIYKGALGLSLLLILFALPKYIQTFKVFLEPKPVKPGDGIETTWPLHFASYAFVYNKQFSMLFFLGLVMDVVISRIF
ncbi:MAG: prenyltransferase [Bacteroidales bacterium]|nr:prenyltransferase [Bacteroidales bacterium]